MASAKLKLIMLAVPFRGNGWATLSCSSNPPHVKSTPSALDQSRDIGITFTLSVVYFCCLGQGLGPKAIRRLRSVTFAALHRLLRRVIIALKMAKVAGDCDKRPRCVASPKGDAVIWQSFAATIQSGRTDGMARRLLMALA